MNPALPGGASGDQTALTAGVWSAAARLGYTFVPYRKLQQGTDVAPNPNGLGIDVWLGTLGAIVAAPTGTQLDVQLPFGSLITRLLGDRRADHGVGDLELRVRQSLGRWLRSSKLELAVAAGAVAPTGPYVARSGAANLAPEASYLTLGRGVPWWLADLDARYAIDPRLAVFAQLGGRGPVGRTGDGFAWGSEARAALGSRVQVEPWLSVVVSSEVQWRGHASEPDPFSDMRLTSANAGGWQWSASPAVVFAHASGVSVMAGARVPIVSDVVGNQLVPQVGGFVAVSYARRLTPVRRATTQIAVPLGKITVVDYWATWCAPCAEITRALDAAAPRWPDVEIVRVDASKWPGDDAPALPPGASGLPIVEVFDPAGVRKALLLGDDAKRVVERVDQLREQLAPKSEGP